MKPTFDRARGYARNKSIISGRHILQSCPYVGYPKPNGRKCVCVEEIAKVENFGPESIFDEFGNYAFCVAGLKSVVVNDAPFYSQAKVSSYRRRYLIGVQRRTGEDFLHYRFATAKTIIFYCLYDNIYGLLPGATTKKMNESIVHDMARKEDNTLIKLKICTRGGDGGDDGSVPSILKPFERIQMAEAGPGPNKRISSKARTSTLLSECLTEGVSEGVSDGVSEDTPICLSFDVGDSIVPLHAQAITFNVPTQECVLKFKEGAFNLFIDSLKRARGEITQSVSSSVPQTSSQEEHNRESAKRART